MEIEYVPLEQARRSNRALVQEWLTTYSRLYAELLEMSRKLGALDIEYTLSGSSPEYLRKHLERHFAPGLDGFQAVEELRTAKLALEKQLEAVQARLKTAIEEDRRRWRKLVEDIRQTAVSKAALLEFVEETCVAELNSQQQKDLRKQVGTALKDFDLPAVGPEPPPTDIRATLKQAESQLTKARRLVQKAQVTCQTLVDTVRANRAEEHRRKIVQKLSASGKRESLQDFLARHSKSTTAAAAAEDRLQRKLDALLAEVAVLENTAGWQAIQNRAQIIRNERDSARRLMLYEALVLDSDQRVRRLREYNRWVRELDELIDKATTHADQPGIQAICNQLRELRRSGNCAEIKPIALQLEQALAAADKVSLREEKRQLLLKTLKDMGYGVVEGMETALRTAVRIVVQRDGESEYAVEMVVDDELSLVQTNMIRFGEPGETTEQQRLRDKEKEESWCQSHVKIREKLTQHGLTATMKMHLKPGEVPVRVVPDSRRRTASARIARRIGHHGIGG